jgi:hypothetical protein
MIHYFAETTLTNLRFYYGERDIQGYILEFAFDVLGRDSLDNVTPAEDRVLRRLKRFCHDVRRSKGAAKYSFIHVNMNTNLTTVVINGFLHNRIVAPAQNVGSHQPLVPAKPAKNDQPKKDVVSSDTRSLLEVRVSPAKTINYMNSDDRENVLLFVCQVMEIDIVEEVRRAFQRGERLLEGLQAFMDSIDQQQCSAESQFVLVDQVSDCVCSVLNYWHVS